MKEQTTHIAPNNAQKETVVLLFSVFIVGLCTIIYELLIGSISSYFLGDSIKQFSLTIGLTMSAMGLGTYLSRFIRTNLLEKFILIEVVLGLVGGLSVPLLYAAYVVETLYYPIMIVFIVTIGTLIGLEIPLITRIMVKYYSLRQNISNILSLDYLGALFASLIFPFLLLPVFGLFQSSLAAGALNVAVAALTLYFFKNHIPASKTSQARKMITGVFLILGVFFVTEGRLIKFWENLLYEDRVLLSRQTSYQKMVVTKHRKDIRLYLDGNLQFSSIDEYRYHEALVHVPLSFGLPRRQVLILGGGDGLAVRELLKYPEIESIILVDLDPEITTMSMNNKWILEVNEGSLSNPKVKIIHMDAFEFLKNTESYFDFIIADLPDPRNVSLARLYSREFYKLIQKRLSKAGVFVTQSTSPFFSQEAFWCVEATLKSARFAQVLPYHAYVPSFGDWGFVMASSIKPPPQHKLEVKTRFLTGSMIPALFEFSKDLRPGQVEPSTLNDPKIFHYYMQGWQYWH